MDYSQRTTPILTVTDAACTNTTTITSATGGFTALMKGNVLVVNGGLFMITTFTNTNAVVVDKLGGTFSGQTLNVGGAFACKGTVTSALEPIHYGVNVVGQPYWFKNTNAAGVLTSFVPAAGPHLLAPGAEWNLTRYEGYSLVRGDGGIADFGVGGTGAAQATAVFTVVKNLKWRGTFGGATLQAGALGQVLENLVIDATLNANTYALQMGSSSSVVCRCLWVRAPATGSGTCLRENAGATYENCRFDSLGEQNISIESANTPKFKNCVINGGTHGVQINNNTASVQLTGCVLWNCSVNGLDFPVASLHDGEGLLVENCIFGKNVSYDISHTNIDVTGNAGAKAWVNSAFRCNWFFTTGTGRYNRLPAASDDQALTVNPFTNDVTGDFTLNSTTGGGALIRANLCTYAWPDGLNSTVLGAGPYGTLAAAVSSDLANMRSLWREATNERFTPLDPNSPVPDATVDIYLDYGLQALNREAHYHISDATINLVAGTQEYSLPTDFVLAQWLAAGSFKKLERSDFERWMSRGEDWRNEPQGEIKSWAVYANKLVVRPAPSAEAVSSTPTLTMRYVSTPPSITTAGPEQLGSQNYRLVVLYGCLLWSTLYPESLVAQQRIGEIQKLWDASLPRVIAEYAQRNISS